MNNDRRKGLSEVISQLEDAMGLLEELGSDEQDYYDNMPESIQAGEKGDNVQMAIEAIDSAVSSISDSIGSIEEAQA